MLRIHPWRLVISDEPTSDYRRRLYGSSESYRGLQPPLCVVERWMQTPGQLARCPTYLQCQNDGKGVDECCHAMHGKPCLKAELEATKYCGNSPPWTATQSNFAASAIKPVANASPGLGFADAGSPAAMFNAAIRAGSM